MRTQGATVAGGVCPWCGMANCDYSSLRIPRMNYATSAAASSRAISQSDQVSDEPTVWRMRRASSTDSPAATRALPTTCEACPSRAASLFLSAFRNFLFGIWHLRHMVRRGDSNSGDERVELPE